MSGIIEIRENLKRIYNNYDAYINPLLKFLLAMIIFGVINGKLGYMDRINNIAIVLIASLLCSFLPLIIMALLSGLFILLHLYALAPECAAVAAVVLFIMFILYIRFSPDEIIVVLLTPVLFLLKIPYVMPIALGLVGGPLSVVSLAFGVIVAYIVQFTSENAQTITTIDDGNMVSRIRYIVDGMLGNKAMFVAIIAFAITLVLVYTLRRRSMDHAWTIAIGAGTIADIVILLVTDLVFDLNFSIIGLILGSIVAVGVCFAIQLFSFHLDYSKTENLQFEDDDYYYYVKAVPKISVSVPQKRVKKINTARVDRAPSRGSSAKGSSSKNTKARSASGAPKTVHTANGASRTIKN